MSKSKSSTRYCRANGETMPDFIPEPNEWQYFPAKLPPDSPIKLDEIYRVLAFDGVRNPSARSSVSHRVFMTYMTEANGGKPKVGIGESAAEIAVALQALTSPNLHDLRFQPDKVQYIDDNGKQREYTHDLLLISKNGHKRVVFVRNETSLRKPRTLREIDAIAAATPRSLAHDMAIVNASDFSRQRRENLFRMHRFVCDPDIEADELVLATAKKLKSLWMMKDLFPHVALPKPRVFAACYRLVANGKMQTNLDHVFLEHSRIGVRS